MREQPTVFLCSPINSTMFTTCCKVAITDREANCPACKSEVLPRSRDGRWEKAYGPWRKRDASGNTFR